MVFSYIIPIFVRNNIRYMKNQYRIKLEINLKDYNTGSMNSSYDLIIKVLKKDNRFDVAANPKGEYKSFIFTDPTGFVISSNSHDFKGYLGGEMFSIPNKKFLNRKLIRTFPTDYMRKVYLRKIYTSLLAWAEQWDEFSKEPTAKFKSMGNKWYIYITK